jgi:membrane fusion protein, multidrug efflux system
MTSRLPRIQHLPEEHLSDPEPTDAPTNHDARRRRVMLIAGALVALAAVGVGARYYLWALHHESTDDAFIDGHVVHVAPQVGGRVLEVLVTDNQPVRVGDLLVKIDPADFRAKLDQATALSAASRSRLAQARAGLAVAEASQAQAAADVVAARADADNAAADLARYRATTTGAVSKQAVDAASTTTQRMAAQLVVAQKKTAAAGAQVELARSQIEAAEADVKAAAAAVEQARLQLSYTEIRAAEGGRVTTKNVEPGNYVQIGQELLALVSNDVWVTANFKETQLAHMRPGQPAVIYVDAYGHDFHGHVDSVQASSGARFSLLPPENATGNYVKVVQRVPVKIVFDDPAEGGFLLGPGMSVVPEVELR